MPACLPELLCRHARPLHPHSTHLRVSLLVLHQHRLLQPGALPELLLLSISGAGQHRQRLHARQGDALQGKRQRMVGKGGGHVEKVVKLRAKAGSRPAFAAALCEPVGTLLIMLLPV